MFEELPEYDSEDLLKTLKTIIKKVYGVKQNYSFKLMFDNSILLSFGIGVTSDYLVIDSVKYTIRHVKKLQYYDIEETTRCENLQLLLNRYTHLLKTEFQVSYV